MSPLQPFPQHWQANVEIGSNLHKKDDHFTGILCKGEYSGFNNMAGTRRLFHEFLKVRTRKLRLSF